MKGRQRASGLQFDSDGKQGNDFNESRQVLSDRDEFEKEEKGLLDLLGRGLSREFPNPQRVGCPDSAVLRGIASRKLRLADAEPCLEHLSSCSPCFQQFSDFRKEAAGQRRRKYAFLGAAAVLIIALAGWLWVKTQYSDQSTETEVLDLRNVSPVHGHDPIQADQHHLELHRWCKHLILELPNGSKEGADEVALLSETGAPVLASSGTARSKDKGGILKLDLDVSRVHPGQYFLGLRQPGEEWTRYPVRVI